MQEKRVLAYGTYRQLVTEAMMCCPLTGRAKGAGEQALTSLPDMRVMSEVLRCTADARGDHDPPLGGREAGRLRTICRPFHLDKMEEEFPSVGRQIQIQSWLHQPGQVLFVFLGEEPGIEI